MPRYRIHVTGIVQGVGFRPFVYRLAVEAGLVGFVYNDPAGVWIEAQGDSELLARLLVQLKTEAPPLSQVESVSFEELVELEEQSFTIQVSPAGGNAFTLVSPDVALCENCLREMNDPTDRRYHYPFINCTDCGPRYTIIRDLPYDRPLTTMADFPLCADCLKEYQDPLDRRFHAQPVACPVCGPQVRLLSSDGEELAGSKRAIGSTARLLRQGKIVAVKGLGGYHLACDAHSDTAVALLRQRKARLEKPFAVMCPSLDAVRRYCVVDETAAALLTGNRRPIVLLLIRTDGESLALGLAPGQHQLGVMLPYTPLHHLLLGEFGGSLVMTSGNRADEPIAYRDDDALARLSTLADAFLVHNRPIHLRCDDSVVTTLNDGPYFIRRSRGWTPEPVSLPVELPIPLLAVGAEQKNCFALGRKRHAFLSQHIGDMENLSVLRAFEEGIRHLEKLFRVKPEAIAYDPHPEYLPTKWAMEQGLPLIPVQHHRAHVASCLADNGFNDAALGVAWDGTGYGDDGAIWGAELFLADAGTDWRRLCHLGYQPMPGGAAAVRQPWRMAAVWLEAAGVDPYAIPDFGEKLANENWSLLKAAVAKGINSPLTSSGGRLFDAVAALLGVRWKSLYEGQPAIDLEQLADSAETGAYELALDTSSQPWQWDARPLFKQIAAELERGVVKGVISARFHRGVAEGILHAVEKAAVETGVRTVALSGGVFQNRLLTTLLAEELKRRGFTVLLHRRVPTNDGGLALGQLYLAARSIGDK